MTNTKLGVAVIGLGVGEQHALAYASLKECELCFIYDLDKSKSEKIASTLGCEVAESLDQILEDSIVDIVSIASFDDRHFDQAVRALNAGKHVFVEKPMCRSLEELRKIKAVWQESGKILSSNLILRAIPIYQWLQNVIQSGMFGKIYAFDGDYLYGRLNKITEGWRKNVEDYSVIQGGGVHLIDLMLWLTGQRPTNVYAVGNNICTRESDFKYKDFVAATYQFDSGLIGRITANFGCVHKHQYVIRIFGTRLSFIWDDQGPRIYKNRDPSESEVVDVASRYNSKGDLIPPFIRSILDKSYTEKETQHEFDVISVCVAADNSLANRKIVEVEYI